MLEPSCEGLWLPERLMVPRQQQILSSLAGTIPSRSMAVACTLVRCTSCWSPLMRGSGCQNSRWFHVNSGFSPLASCLHTILLPLLSRDVGKTIELDGGYLSKGSYKVCYHSSLPPSCGHTKTAAWYSTLGVLFIPPSFLNMAAWYSTHTSCPVHPHTSCSCKNMVVWYSSYTYRLVFPCSSVTNMQ